MQTTKVPGMEGVVSLICSWVRNSGKSARYEYWSMVRTPPFYDSCPVQNQIQERTQAIRLECPKAALSKHGGHRCFLLYRCIRGLACEQYVFVSLLLAGWEEVRSTPRTLSGREESVVVPVRRHGWVRRPKDTPWFNASTSHNTTTNKRKYGRLMSTV